MLDICCDCVNVFLHGLCGVRSSVPSIGQINIFDSTSTFILHYIWEAQIPRVLIFEPFEEREDGGLSLGVSVLRLFIVDKVW